MKKKQLKKLAETVVRKLGENYPDAKCHLDFTNDFELLISTVHVARSFIF
jgi:endonuclease III